MRLAIAGLRCSNVFVIGCLRGPLSRVKNIVCKFAQISSTSLGFACMLANKCVKRWACVWSFFFEDLESCIMACFIWSGFIFPITSTIISAGSGTLSVKPNFFNKSALRLAGDKTANRLRYLIICFANSVNCDSKKWRKSRFSASLKVCVCGSANMSRRT